MLIKARHVLPRADGRQVDRTTLDFGNDRAQVAFQKLSAVSLHSGLIVGGAIRQYDQNLVRLGPP